ncbi:MAG: M15 family metallopeptidase [Akkermansiaceae bacterium]|nr:M15 family metallopeptidase [Akkermansiaceae bacterium]
MDVASQEIFEQLGLTVSDFTGRGLVPFADADELETVQVDEDGRVHELVPAACAAWEAMKQAAQCDGVELYIVSAFRSIARQAEIVRAKFLAGQGNDEIFAVSAPPGFSEHHTGRAIDVSAPGEAVLEAEFEQSSAFDWLERNATRFGFTMTYPRDNTYGFSYEPWHWCYHGD